MAATEGKVVTCKAAITYNYNTPFKVETIKVLPPTPGHVRVKLVATALCHSDLSISEGYSEGLKLPCILGHEGAGIVESIGEGVTSVKKGDKVFTLYFPHCGECHFCLAKRINYCEDIRRKIPAISYMRNVGLDGLSSYSTLDGQPIYHGYGASAFSEYSVVPANSCVKINPNTNLLNGCILACGFLTGYGSSANAVTIERGDKVAVWGMGGVGLACVVGCKAKGAGQIIGIDVNPDKEIYARKFGCTDFVALSKLGNVSIKEKIFQLTNKGLDYAFVCVGNAQALEEAIDCLTVGGTIVMVGVTRYTDTIKVSSRILLSQIKITGTNYGGYQIFKDVPKMVDRYVNNELPEVNEFITNRFTLDQINDAVAIMQKGNGIRSVIQF